jgi:flagellar motility protein MotE (MotC chaperone)
MKLMPRKPPGPGAAPTERERRGRLPSLRVLPVMIFVAVLMLSVRVNDVWRGMAGGISVNQSNAQQPPPPGGRKPGQHSPTPADPDPTAGSPATAGGAAKNSAASSPAPPEQSGGGDGEPPTFTQSEIDVLQRLSVRREALDGRQKELDQRENLVKAAEARIDKKITEMKTLQTNIEGMLKQVDRQDEEKMKSLVKIYETMKPKDAANILSTLELPVQMGVLGRMKESKVALILAAMEISKAQAVTDAMAARRGAKAEGQSN